LHRNENVYLPTLPRHIAVISSTGAAGYADFIKILDDQVGRTD
jgi:exonuclease VII large subunit